MRLAIIPARGGSKRIPRKNLKPFCGKPMLAWSIEAASAPGLFDAVVVSTDDDEIAKVARAHGAEVPFRRPAALADDRTGTAAVVAHAIGEMQALGRRPDLVCCIYATAPFVRPVDLRRGLQALIDGDATYAFSATSYPFPIQRALKVRPSGGVDMFEPEHRMTRSQDLEAAYHDAGQFYWGRRTAWLDAAPVFSPDARAVILPRHRVQDIDTDEDWLRAEWMFQALQATEPVTAAA